MVPGGTPDKRPRRRRRRARTDLPLDADLPAAGLRHRQGHGRQPRTRRSSRRSSTRRRSARCCASSNRRAGAAEDAAGRADVRPFRDAVAQHRARRCCRITTSTSPTGTTRATFRLCEGNFGLEDYTEHLIEFHGSAGSGLAHGGDLPAVGVGAGRRRDHVGGRSSGAAGEPDADGGSDRYAHLADQGQRIRDHAPARAGSSAT